MTDRGVAHLRELEGLQWLDLSETQVTDASVPALERLGSLRRLDLWDTKMSEDGVAKLARALPNCAVAT